ncbi:MAG: TrkA family potassium uptake protein [Gemmatimonadetes bacterium]|nr:TrkA family potassium uptake protein [Gemmatimonadota bacterium]
MAIRRFVIVGLGNFGSGLVEMLRARGHDVIAVDVSEARVEAVRRYASRAAVADATEPAALERLGAAGADAGVVSVGTDIASSVLAVMALGDVGVREIYAKAISAEHAKILDRLGVTEVIRPERETAFRLGTRLSMRLLNYMPIAPGHSMQEMPTPDAFIGETLLDLKLPQKYGIAIVAIHDVLTDALHVVPPADYVLKDSDTLLIVGSDEALGRLSRLTPG